MKNNENYLVLLFLNKDNISHQQKGYIERSLYNLSIKSSKENYNLEDYETVKEMVKEWVFIDSPNNFQIKASEKCMLCNRPDSVYQFKIINKFNNQELWVGSTCIKNLTIPIQLDNNEELDLNDTKRINELFNKYKINNQKQNRIKLLRNVIFELIHPEYQNNIKIHRMCFDETITGKERNEYSERLFRRILELKEQGKTTKRIYVPTQINFEKGEFSIGQLKRIFVNYSQYYNEVNGMDFAIVVEDIVKLFKINWKNKYSKRELLYLEPFQWIQLSPIIPKRYFTKSFGFTDYTYKKCMNIIEYKLKEHPSYEIYKKKFTSLKKESVSK